MIQFITVIHILVCVVLVLVVLLQQGKKDGMGAAFGGGSQSVFGARGAETFLEKFTKILAGFFMITSLSLVYMASRESGTSILSDEGKPAESAPATTSPEAPTTASEPAGVETAPAEPTSPSATPDTK